MGDPSVEGRFSLPIGQGVVAARGRPAVAPRSGMTSTEPPAASIAARRAAEKPCAFTVSDLVTAPRASTFTRPRLATRPTAPQRVGVDDGSRVEPLECLQVDDRVLHAERVAEPLRLRRAAIDRRLAALEARATGPRRTLTLRAAPGGLATLATDAAPDASGGSRLRSLRRLQIVDLQHVIGPLSDLLDGDEMRDTRDHAADLGAVGVLHGVVDALQAERAQRPALLGLAADGRAHLCDLRVFPLRTLITRPR